ncbi:MAG: phosphoribosylanthranilate isomerase [Acidobacteriota bacterium]|nr:phosphoribosylanthranilate isomerase [Acidobacteriota bacterium]
MNKPKIKICGMREAENMREIACLEPDFFGLIFYPKSPRFVSVEQAEKLPAFENIRRVGVFVDEDAEQILEIAERADLQFIQLHGNETARFCESLKKQNLQVVKVFKVDKNFDGKLLQEFEAVCDYFLFDTKADKHGGSGRIFDWQILRRFSINKPFFLGGGIGAENASEAIEASENLPLFALDVNSRAEIAAGVKSPQIVRGIIQHRNTEIQKS